MNTVNSPTKINHVFIVTKTIYNIELDTQSNDTKKISDGKRFNSVSRVEMINIPVLLYDGLELGVRLLTESN